MTKPAVALAGVLLLSATRAAATVFVPLTLADLTRSAVAVVVATVDRMASVVERDGNVTTLVTLRVDDTLAGGLPAAEITLREDGGVVGGRYEVVFGAPSFHVGERTLVFVSARPDGSLRTSHLSLGKFRIEVGSNGMPWVVPAPLVAGGDAAARPSPLGAGAPLDQVVAAVESRRTEIAVVDHVIDGAPIDGPGVVVRREVSGTFEFDTPTRRFFEPDEGVPVAFLIDQRGDSTLGPATSRRALASAFAAWTDLPAASIVLDDGGLTADLGTPCPGPSKVVFDDPDGSIPDPVDCHGALAVTGLGGPCASSFESKTFDGRTFRRVLRARVTFANGWRDCPIWTECNLAEIATHELGHAVGVGHSSERADETDAVRRDSTMYFKAHFDGRCAGLRSDDAAGASALYPTSQPPTITTADPLPDARSGAPYRVMLDAVGGTGVFTWSLVRGGVPGLVLAADGTITGVPDYGVQTFFQVQATDSAGDSHTKVLHIHVAGPTPTRTAVAMATATPTVTPSAEATRTSTAAPLASETASPPPSSTVAPVPPTPTPTASVTPSLTPTAVGRVCTGDCNRSATVTIEEIVVMVTVALGQREMSACAAGDRNADGQISVDEVVAAVNAALQGCPAVAVGRLGGAAGTRRHALVAGVYT